MSNGLTIYSFGDADFMGSVLNAVAMLTNNGDIYRLAMIGAMVGLIMVGLRMIVTGGREFPFWHLLLGLVLAVIFLKPTTDVWVQPITPQPGSVYNTAQKVSNVPYLVALPGFFLSNIGYALTLDMEQAFSMPDGSGITSNGMSTPMELMAAPSKLFQACQAGGALACSTAAAEMQTYLHDCAFPAAAKGELPMSQNLNTLTGMASIDVQDKWLTTTTRLPANGDASAAAQGTATSVSCPELSARLGKLFGDKTLYGKLLDSTSVAQAAQKKTGVSATDAVAGAFSNYGFAIGGKLGDYYASLLMASNWRAAKTGGPMAFEQTQGMDTAVEQASFQRMMQASGESNMFLRIMRPMIGFFESLIYALAPFMAFLLLLGPFGWKMITRYAMVTLWVEMWFPILAIVNLYGSWQLTHAANITNAMIASGTALSNIGMINTTDQIVSLLTSSAMLVAATPAIALSIVYGTSITATFLAGKLGGADHINEKIPAPDGWKEMPISQNSAIFSGDQTSGAYRSGQPGVQTTFTVNNAKAHQAESAYRAMQTSSLGFSSALTHAFNDGLQWSSQDSSVASDQLTSAHDTSLTDAASLLRQSGVQVNNNQDVVDASMVFSSAEHGSTSTTGSTEGYATKTGAEASASTPQVKGAPKSPGVSGSMGANLHTDLYNKDEASKSYKEGAGQDGSARHTRQWAQSVMAAAGRNQQLADALRTTAAHSVQAVANTTSGQSRGITNTSALGRAASDLDTKAQTYSNKALESASSTVGETIGVNALSKSVLDDLKASGGFDSFRASGEALLGRHSIDLNKGSVDVKGIPDHDQQEVAAILLGLHGDGRGAGFMPREHAEARAEMFNQILANHGDLGGVNAAATSGNAEANAGIASDVAPGAARAEAANVTGSSTNDTNMAAAQGAVAASTQTTRDDVAVNSNSNPGAVDAYEKHAEAAKTQTQYDPNDPIHKGARDVSVRSGNKHEQAAEQYDDVSKPFYEKLEFWKK